MSTTFIPWQDLTVYLLLLLLPADDAALQAMDEADRATLIGILGTLHEQAIAASNTAQAA
jgi:hypothetical protein